MSNKFLSFGSGGSASNLNDGTTPVYASTLGSADLDGSKNVMTNSNGILTTGDLAISDVTSLQTKLDSLDSDITSIVSDVAIYAGDISVNYANINALETELDTKTANMEGDIIANFSNIQLCVQGGSTSTDGGLAIYDGTGGKLLKHTSNLSYDDGGTGTLKVGNSIEAGGSSGYLRLNTINLVVADDLLFLKKDNAFSNPLGGKGSGTWKTSVRFSPNATSTFYSDDFIEFEWDSVNNQAKYKPKNFPNNYIDYSIMYIKGGTTDTVKSKASYVRFYNGTSYYFTGSSVNADYNITSYGSRQWLSVCAESSISTPVYRLSLMAGAYNSNINVTIEKQFPSDTSLDFSSNSSYVGIGGGVGATA